MKLLILTDLFLGHSSRMPLSKAAGDKNLQMSRQKTHLLVLNGDTGLALSSFQSKRPVQLRNVRGMEEAFAACCIAP